MYKKSIPHHDFFDKPRNETVHFNLTEREVFKLLAEFQRVFAWQKSIDGPDQRDLDTAEVIDFYNDFEEILLSAYGVPSEDGRHFHKQGKRYEFEDSALFAGCMKLFVENPMETTKLIDGLMPKDLQAMVEKADANLAELAKSEDASEDLKAEVARLRAMVADQS